jgi:nicotinamidase-related amidase
MSLPVPPLHKQWQSLDFPDLLSRPTAFVSISQCNSLYHPDGKQGAEKQWERGTLENTVKVAKASREAGHTFFWIGYDIFRDEYPKSPLDEAQYGAWSKAFGTAGMTKEQRDWDIALSPELRELVEPGDHEFYEYAHQCSFYGTPLNMMLKRHNIETMIMCGLHLNWCIEGNSRAARDEGYMPIVVGDATSCQKIEDDAPTIERLNTIVCPVLSADQMVQYIRESIKKTKAA